MKTKLIVFVLSAAILGSSSAALARGDKGKRYEEPRVQHSQQRDWGKKRHQARGHRDVHGSRHHDRRMDRHPRNGRGWSRHQPRYRHGFSHRRHHGSYTRRGHGYPVHRGHAPARPYYRSDSGLSITFHGHF